MADAKPPNEPQEGAAPPPSASSTRVDPAPAWEAFRAGDVALCPVDRAPLALAVDGSASVYRFVCVKCGIASPWFEVDATGVRVRGPRVPSAAAPE